MSAIIQFAAKESLRFALENSISDISHIYASFATDAFQQLIIVL